MQEVKERFATIFWDFDGVLMFSNAIRDRGFEEVLSEYPKEQVAKLMEFHQKNGGLSRYVKFRYFFEEIRKEAITDKEVLYWATKFSEVMRKLLVDTSLLNAETIAFVKKYHKEVPMHIVSGSDQEELRYLCTAMGIAPYFKSIHGSPKPKTQWVAELLQLHPYPTKNCLLIGDSINDFEAAQNNGLEFLGYNNTKVELLSTIKLNLV